MNKFLLPLIAFSILMSACGAPPEEGGVASSKTASCDVKKAKKVLFGNEEEPVPAEQEQLLCEKAKSLLEDEENAKKADKNPGDPIPPPEASPIYYEEGIFGREETSELPPSEYEYSSVWRGVIKKRNIAVFAGWQNADPSSAIVMLWDGDPLTGTYDKFFYPAPIAGPLQIRSAENPEVVVANDFGETAVFDASKREWLKKGS